MCKFEECFIRSDLLTLAMSGRRALAAALSEVPNSRSFFGKAAAAPEDKLVDVAIVGGGMVGAGLARALGEQCLL